MNTNQTLALLAASALITIPTGASAQFGRAPSGSYTQSCQAIQTDANGYLSAECRADAQGRYRWSAIYAPQCRGDISNRSGMLYCDGATATGGEYVAGSPERGASTGEQVVGAILGSIFGVPAAQTQDQDLYAPGYRYPMFGQSGYGDPRFDPRFARGGWGFGAPAGQFMAISQRRDWLEDRITQAVRQRSLSQAEATRLRSELADIVRLETTYRSNAFTTAERQDLDRRFDTLAARIMISGQQETWMPISERRSDVERRIDEALRRRDITPQEAGRLRADFEDLVRLEATYRQGGLTAIEQSELDRRFEVIDDRLDGGGPGRGPWLPMADRQTEVYTGIDAALRDRRITTQEAARLRTEFQAIMRLEQSYGPGRPSRTEQDELDRRFDIIADRIGLDWAGQPDRWRPLASRQTEVNAGIEQEAARLRAEFQDLLRLETTYRQGGLTAVEQAELQRRFGLLADRIGLRDSDRADEWVAIGQRQPNLATRIDAGVRNGAISALEAAQLRSEYQSLLRLETTYGQGGLTVSEQADLDSRYDSLRQRIRSER